MLVLTRRIGEEIVIGGNIRVTVLSIQGDRIRLGINAPRSVSVDRAEVYERRRFSEPDSVPCSVPISTHAVCQPVLK
jgi:carbon storage regulator CsrA